MIFTNANDTNKKEDSMLSYYNYTSNNTFVTYESSGNKIDDNRYFLKDSNKINFKELNSNKNKNKNTFSVNYHRNFELNKGVS